MEKKKRGLDDENVLGSDNGVICIQSDNDCRSADDTNVESCQNHAEQNGVVCTNFSIDEILKPTFGKRKSNFDSIHFSAFTPVTSRLSVKDYVCMDQDHLVRSANVVPSIRPKSLSPISTSSGPGSPGSISSPNMSSPESEKQLWPAWVYCTRYSDRPSAGPRSRKTIKKKISEEKRPRTAFTSEQLQILKKEFENSRYLTEQRRNQLSRELDLSESQIKIWFQNKRAKIKKATGNKNSLALTLMAHGLYNHSTMTINSDDEEEKERKKNM